MTHDNEWGRHRVAIEAVTPLVDCGRFPIKRIQGDRIAVEADLFADGHEEIRGVLLWRHEKSADWSQAELGLFFNDRWRASFDVREIGRYHYTIRGWVDRFQTWRHDLAKRVAAGADAKVDLLIGAQLVAESAERARGPDAARLKEFAATLSGAKSPEERAQIADSPVLVGLMDRYPDLQFATTLDPPLTVTVDRERARFSAWYEMFPRSTSPTPGGHGTFADCEARLPYVAEMGFNVLYFPPIHPIGAAFRKGKNNSPTALASDVGSPWAIGAADGGHKGVLRELGTLADFHSLVAAAASRGIEIALDIAYQCSPDHPYVAAHPEWFRKRPDGTIQYAENPPKKYQDIYPFDFETPAWRPLWDELKSVVSFWAEQGVRIFRVDNPHTKPFAFWEWMIDDLKRQDPDLIFLSEAFTRPKVMYRLAKLGFTQSYTYFTWRNTKQELTEYLEEITRPAMRDFFRPNLWTNTPDILSEYLQSGQRAAFIARLVLAATLAANFGVYGPPFELCVATARESQSEEYLGSEKYEIPHWQLDRPESLRDVIARVNRARRENRALQSDANLEFHPVESDQLICYSKRTDDGANVVVAVVNLDPYHAHSGNVQLPLAQLGVREDKPYQMEDLLSGTRYTWQGNRGWVDLAPQPMPAHLFRLRRWVRTDGTFEVFDEQ
ncbi:MAG TPA: alpha-1,4-glucan--maltose-1-phosphate maltosyltransferase [Pirellulales bacterium]|nr:alpha-1,4-glucan--maltose-1-phosphate maltosyltransferase [Pirellulales bacterium]